VGGWRRRFGWSDWIMMPFTREGTIKRADIIGIKFSQKDGMGIKRFKKIYAHTLSLVISSKEVT